MAEKYLRFNADNRDIVERVNMLIKRVLDNQEYAGNPTSNVTPRWVRDWCLDTVSGAWYVSTGLTTTSWQAV